MLIALRPWQLRSSSAHCDPELAKRIGEKVGEENWRDTWQGGLATHLAKRLCEQEEVATRRRRRRRRRSYDKI